jgi:hypothetical protein
MNLVWSGTDYTDPGTVLVLLALADWSNDQGTSWPSIPQLAQKSRMSERQIQYILGQLGKDRIVEMELGGGRKPNTYRLNIPLLERSQAKIPFPIDECQVLPAVHTVHRCTPCTGAQDAPLPDSPPSPYKELPPTPSQEQPSRTTTLSGTPEISTEGAGNLPKTVGDPRHDVIRRGITKLQMEVGREEVWDGSAGRVLDRLLKLRSKWTARFLLRCVANRFASVNVNALEHPRRWLGSLSDYGYGPVDQYGKLARKQWPLAEELFATIKPAPQEVPDV